MKKLIFAAVILTLTTLQAHAVPKILNYQGFLTESGTPVTGTRDMTFHIFAAPTGGSALFTEVHDGADTVTVSTGNFSVLVGELTGGGIPAAVFNGSDRYMEVVVGAVTLPRQRIVSVAYAIRSETAMAVRPLMRFTRATLASTDSDAGKEALCVSELGDEYTAANLSEVTTLSGTGLSIALNHYFTCAGTLIRWTYGQGEPGQYPPGMEFLARDSGSGQIACVYRAAPMRATRTLVTPTNSDAAKDAQCASEFGNDYVAATVLDLATVSRGLLGTFDPTVTSPPIHVVFATETETFGIAQGAIIPFSYTPFTPPTQSALVCIRR